MQKRDLVIIRGGAGGLVVAGNCSVRVPGGWSNGSIAWCREFMNE